jgi:hypothetical protein
MVLGTTREQPRIEGRTEGEDASTAFSPDHWRAERGAVRWESGADLAGGFPGFADRGGRLIGVQLRLTDRYLLVEEGRPHGFGLALSWLLGADLVLASRSERADPCLRVRFTDGFQVRTFLARFRGSLLAPRGGRRAEQALAALHSLGLAEAGEPLPAEPDVAHSWDEAARFDGENVIWSGRASAVLGANGERAACDVWLTTRSIIWGSSVGDGILRLPCEAILDAVPVDLADRARTPAVYVACADEWGGRHEFPFVFDRDSPPQRNVRERGAFLVGLRSRGVALGTPPLLPQPWRSDAVSRAVPPAETAATSERVRLGGHQRPRRPVPTGRFQPRPQAAEEVAAPGRWERAMAEWTGQANRPEPPADVPVPDEAAVRERLQRIFADPAPDEAPAAETSAVETPDRPSRGVIVPWPGTNRAHRLGAFGGAATGDALAAPAPVIEPDPTDVAATRAGLAVFSEPGAVESSEQESASALPAIGSWPVPAGFLGAAAVFASPLEDDDTSSPEPPAGADPADPLPDPGHPLPVDAAGQEGTTADEPITGRETAVVESVVVESAAPESVLAERQPAASEPVPPASDPRAILRRYEEAALRMITEAVRAIEERLAGGTAVLPTVPTPSPDERAAALAALDALVELGELAPAQADVHRALLVAAGEAGPRLRSLIELHGAGYLIDEDLDRKRRTIVAPIATLLAR